MSALDSAMLMAHAIEIMREHVDPGSKEAPTTINYAFPDCGNAYPVVVPDRADIWIVGRFNSAALLKDVLEKVRKAGRGVRAGDRNHGRRGVHHSYSQYDTEQDHIRRYI